MKALVLFLAFAPADTLIFGIGGKAFKVWSDVGK
jgi:hypothetical protein